MKKIFTFLLAIGFALNLSAQLPDGSIAPNFTGVDLNGNTWNLYDILDQGKSVIMDVSATWCGPCWSYHQTHALRDLYNTHGPAGDDKLMVLWIEGDTDTNIDCIYDNAGCNDSSQGDWTEDSPFPIIDDTDGTINDDFSIGYFPTIYLICPDRIIREAGQVSATQLWTDVQACKQASGTNNAGASNLDRGTPQSEVCGELDLDPTFNLVNYGTAPLTAATITVKYNGTSVQTVNWTGNLPTYNAERVALGGLTVSEAGALAIEISGVNGGNDDDAADNTISTDITNAKNFGTQKILLKLKTDNYGNETYWEFRDGNGMVLLSGGNDAVGPNGGGGGVTPPASPNAYGNGVTIRDTLVVPDNGCFSFHIVDYYGDGICCAGGTGYYRLYNITNTITAILEGGEFAEDEARPFGVAGITGTNDLVSEADFDVYPNPASSDLMVDFLLTDKSDVAVYITNAMGQVVKTVPTAQYAKGFYTEKVNLSNLANGLYFLNLGTDEGVVTRKFTVLK